MRYIGSKASTVGDVYARIAERIPNGSLCDPFGGMGTVGAHFKRNGWQVWSGDVLRCAHAFQVARLQLSRTPSFRRLRAGLGLRRTDDLLSVLNATARQSGWIVDEFALRRGFFTIENAERIEACRCAILDWQRQGYLTDSEACVLTASLIESMDRVANIAGTYYAYLKGLYRKARKPFAFQLVKPVVGPRRCTAVLCDARELATRRPYDVLYLDPPYNGRNYARYYHLPESIARGIAPPSDSVSGVPACGEAVSDFCSRKSALAGLSDILSSARFRLGVVQYADGGLVSPAEIRDLLSMHGRVDEFVLSSTGYRTRTGSRATEHRLYVVDNA